MANDRANSPPDTPSNALPGRHESGPPATPRWVLALGLIAVALIVIFIVAQMFFGLQHGPGMHGSAASVAAILVS